MCPPVPPCSLWWCWKSPGLRGLEVAAVAQQAVQRHALPAEDVQAQLPKVLPAGVQAGTMTEAGARLLDPSGTLEAGFPLCPPEGDAGTGMAATNAVAVRTGNVFACRWGTCRMPRPRP